MKRQVFDTVEELKEEVKRTSGKKTPYAVNVNGRKRYTLAGNSDQAIAAVARCDGATVESVPLMDLIQC